MTEVGEFAYFNLVNRDSFTRVFAEELQDEFFEGLAYFWPMNGRNQMVRLDWSMWSLENESYDLLFGKMDGIVEDLVTKRYETVVFKWTLENKRVVMVI